MSLAQYAVQTAPQRDRWRVAPDEGWRRLHYRNIRSEYYSIKFRNFRISEKLFIKI